MMNRSGSEVNRLQMNPYGMRPLSVLSAGRSCRRRRSPEGAGAAVRGCAFDGRVLDGAVHALDLAVSPRMIDLGEPVLDTVLAAHENMWVSIALLVRWRSAADSVTGCHYR